MSAISIRLGSLRVARRLTQQELADRVGVRRDTISALERGKTRGIEFDTLARLCGALGCTPNDLLELGPTAHIVPVLGGEDEDEIIAERLAEAEGEIATLLAEPSRAALALTLDLDDMFDGIAQHDRTATSSREGSMPITEFAAVPAGTRLGHRQMAHRYIFTSACVRDVENLARKTPHPAARRAYSGDPRRPPWCGRGKSWPATQPLWVRPGTRHGRSLPSRLCYPR